jgi:hypothetical protein
MSFHIELHPSEPAIVFTLNPDYDLLNEIDLSTSTLIERISTQALYDRLYLINVFKLKISVDEIVVGANRAARGQQSAWHHPKLKQVVLVTQDETLRLAAAGMASKAFGNLSVPVFATLDEAMAYVRANKDA